MEDASHESTDDFVTVATVGDIPEGEGRTVQLGNRPVAIFLYQGNYMAIDDLCPHQGASLGAGSIDCHDETEDETDCNEAPREGPTVSCPWHAWRFRLSDGKWADNPRLGVETFETRVVGEAIQVRPSVSE